MANNRTNTVWALYPPGRYPQVYVSTADEKNIKIEFCYKQAMSGDIVKLTRHQARILSRRIMQCLNGTKKTRR